MRLASPNSVHGRTSRWAPSAMGESLIRGHSAVHGRRSPGILSVMSEERATLPEISAEIKEAARLAGGGWLDEVVGGHTAPVPLSAVRGAWKLGADGELTG